MKYIKIFPKILLKHIPYKYKGRIDMKIIKYVVFTLLLIALSTSTAILTYLHFFATDDKNLSGEWTVNLDMTDQAAVTAFVWLQDIEAVSVSLEDMGTYMQGLTIQVNLTMEQTDNLEGIFSCNVSRESYDACKQAAYEAFAAAFKELLAERLHMAGYTVSADREDIEALVTEAFGMSTVSYLMSYGPALIPPFEDLQAEYDGSGTYEVAEDILIRQFDTGGSATVKSEHYILNDYNLILSGEAVSDSADAPSDCYPVIYSLMQPVNQ